MSCENINANDNKRSNLMDNTIDHGTVEDRKLIMGYKYNMWAEATYGDLDAVDEKDFVPFPCFGKVIKGFEVVDQIAKGATRASLPKGDEEEYEEESGDGEGPIRLDDTLLLRPVKIASVTILKEPKSELQEKRNKKNEEKVEREL